MKIPPFLSASFIQSNKNHEIAFFFFPVTRCCDCAVNNNKNKFVCCGGLVAPVAANRLLRLQSVDPPLSPHSIDFRASKILAHNQTREQMLSRNKNEKKKNRRWPMMMGNNGSTDPPAGRQHFAHTRSPRSFINQFVSSSSSSFSQITSLPYPT